MEQRVEAIKLLIESYDALQGLDELISRISGASLMQGEFEDIAKIYDAILCLSDQTWQIMNVKTEEKFDKLLRDTTKTADERAELLVNPIAED